MESSSLACDDGCVRQGDLNMERLRGRDFSGDSTTENIIRCILKVHSGLGPGFLESIYRNALSLELRANGMSAEMETDVKILYLGRLVGRHRLDFLVDDR